MLIRNSGTRDFIVLLLYATLPGYGYRGGLQGAPVYSRQGRRLGVHQFGLPFKVCEFVRLSTTNVQYSTIVRQDELSVAQLADIGN